MRTAFSSLSALAVAVVVSSGWALDATSADNLAQAVLTQLGHSRGVTALPNCGDGQLARAFVQHSGMKVHAMDSDTSKVTQARELMASIGATPPGCYVDRGSLSVMPYADRFVDCIVITNLVDANLSGISYAEIERALCPGGQAWVGRATSEGAGITQAALQSWVNGAARSYSTATVSTTQGTWAVISRSELPGVDTWPRRAYDAAGTRSSRDTVAGFPWLPQARIKPYNHGQGSVVASGGKLYMAFPDNCIPTSKNWVRAYNIYNGELLWQYNLADALSLTSDFMTAAPWGLYIRGGSTVQLDGNTGAVVTPQTTIPADRPGQAFTGINGGGCGPTSASAKVIYGQMYALGYDRVNNRNLIYHPYKAPCQTGVAVSNGLSIFAANFCMCNFVPGTMLEASAGSFTFDRAAAADGSDRIERGPAYGSVAASVVPDAQDWPTYRANNRRSGNSVVNVAAVDAAPALLWNVAPAKNYVTAAASFVYDINPEQAPTAPVVVGNYTFFGGTDGYVRCVDNTLGRLAWSYATGGRIYAAPTVALGCVYVGSGDGWAYCIEAHTGRLVWRFRAAPVDRRFNLFGYLSSTWPVIGGVLVEGNRAYFAGGLASEYGTHLYCVDALSGALQWQNNSSGTSYIAAGRLGFSPEGPMAVANGKLLANSAATPIMSFNLSTGAQDPMPTEFTSNGTYMTGYSFGWANFGREIGVLDNTHMFAGGMWCFSDLFDRMGGAQKNKTFWFQRIDGSGRVLYPKVTIAPYAWVCPSWDGQDFFMPTNNSGTLVKAAASRVAAVVDSGVAASPGVVSTDPSYPPTALWTKSGMYLNATALSPAGLVIVFTHSVVDMMSLLAKPEESDWYLALLDRNTGAIKWQVALPDIPGGLKGEPLVQGLAIDRNGNIILTQRNGNVLCYAKGDVSVAVPQLQMPARPAIARAAATQSWSVATSASAPVPVSPAPATSAPTTSAEPASVALSVPVALEPVVVQPQVSGPDTSDMITQTNGARYHAYPPEIRALQPRHDPADMSWKPQRQCLPVVSVHASSSVGKANGSSNTLDRDLRTRWSAARTSSGAEQSLTYDLGSRHTVEAVSIVWRNASAAPVPFSIAVSADGKTYETAESGMLDGKGTNTALRTFFPVTARFVRVAFAPARGAACPSVYEVGIHECTAGQRASAE